jgi:hypothetical protein
MINNFVERAEYQPSHQVYTHPTTNHAIFIGDIQAALDVPAILAQGITTGTHPPHAVVTAATGLHHVSYNPPITHIVYPLLDMKSENISKFFTQFYDLVER